MTEPAYRDKVRLKFLLRPGWISMILAALVFAALCFSVLSPWQFRRNHEQATQNNAIQASFTARPVPLDQVLRPGQAPDPHVEWRTVTMTGTYLPGAETVARLRSVETEPAYEVLTPLRLTDGTVVLVDRGYVRPTDGTKVPGFAGAPAGPVSLTARVRQDEIDPKHRDALAVDGVRQVYTIDSQTVAKATGLTIRPGYFELTDNQPGVLSPLPLPDLESGPFFAYAVQWIIFGGFALFGVGYLIWRELHPESDDELDIADLDDLDEDDAPDGPDTEPGATPARAESATAAPTVTAAERKAAPRGTDPDPTAQTSTPDPENPAPATKSAPASAASPDRSGPPGAPPLVPADRYGRRR